MLSLYHLLLKDNCCPTTRLNLAPFVYGHVVLIHCGKTYPTMKINLTHLSLKVFKRYKGYNGIFIHTILYTILYILLIIYCSLSVSPDPDQPLMAVVVLLKGVPYQRAIRLYNYKTRELKRELKLHGIQRSVHTLCM